MNCVACNEPLVVLEMAGVEIDHCLACGGIWLDAGELELLLHDKRESDRLLTQIGTMMNRQSEKRKCPICLKKMDEIKVGASGDVQIDCCRNNHGLWFDRGELQTVLAIFDSNLESPVHELLRSMFGK